MRPGRNLAFRNTRRVWAAISADPRREIRTLARELRLDYHTVYAALHRLRDAGYIDWNPSGYRELRIVIPFIITGKETPCKS